MTLQFGAKQCLIMRTVKNEKHIIDPDVILVGSSSDESEPDSSECDPVTAVPTDVVATQTVESSDTNGQQSCLGQQVSMQSGYPPVIHEVHHILHYAQGNYPLPSAQSIMASVPSAISPFLFNMPFHHAPVQYPPHGLVHPPPHAPVHGLVHPPYVPHHVPPPHAHVPPPHVHVPGHAPVPPLHAPVPPHHAHVPPPHVPVHVPGHDPVHPPHSPVHPLPNSPVHAPVHPLPNTPAHGLVHPPYVPHHGPVHPPPHAPVHSPVHPSPLAPVHAPGHDPVPDTHHKAPTTAVKAKSNAPAPPTTAVKVKSKSPAPPTTAVKVKSKSPAPPTTAVKVNAPSLASVTASIHRRQAAPSGPICIPAQPLHNKRKIKSRADDDVPHDEAPPKEDASMAQEKNVNKQSINAFKYQSDVTNVIKKLRTQSNVTAPKGGKGVVVQNSRGRIPLKTKMLQGNATLYDGLKEYLLSEQTRIEQGYPFRNTRKRYAAVLLGGDKRVTTDSSERICSRCGATYSVSQTGRHTRMKECNYHYGKGVEQRVPGGVETRYSCCEAVMGSPGCQVFKMHVHDAVNLDGFVFTQPRPTTDTSCPGVYSLNCEKCYTTRGVELSRVTLVNSSMQILYDTLVRPANDVIDYNTRFSGISEKNVKDVTVSLKEVQKTLLNLIRADTILIGHSLDMDLCLLKLTHEAVVDTSVVFPHSLGPPHKLALNTLVGYHLRRIVQDRGSGHDTAVDAAACMELMLWKIKEGGKVRRV